MSFTTIVIALKLDDAAESPAGTATVPGGEPRPFYGWIGLAAAIDALTHAHDDARDERPLARTSTEGETP